MKSLWELASWGHDDRERSAWLLRDDHLNYSGMVVWPWNAERGQATWNATRSPKGTFANAHVHPDGYDPRPSVSGGRTGRGDMALIDKGFSIYVLSRSGIFFQTAFEGPVLLAGKGWWEKPPCGNMK